MHFNTNHTHSSAQTLTSGNSKQFGLFSDSLNLGYLGKNNSRNKSTTVKLRSTTTTTEFPQSLISLLSTESQCSYLVASHGESNHIFSLEHPDVVHRLVFLYVLLMAMTHPSPALFSLLPPSFSLFAQHLPPKQCQTASEPNAS